MEIFGSLAMCNTGSRISLIEPPRGLGLMDCSCDALGYRVQVIISVQARLFFCFFEQATTFPGI